MSEPESKRPNRPKHYLVVGQDIFDRIKAVADSQAADAVEGPLALKDEEDLARDYPEALSLVQRAREDAEIEELEEGGRHRRRVNRAKLTILGSLLLLIVLWIISVMFLTSALGFRWRGFMLSDNVIITYITTTTASVFGLFFVAARWLYRIKSDD